MNLYRTTHMRMGEIASGAKYRIEEKSISTQLKLSNSRTENIKKV